MTQPAERSFASLIGDVLRDAQHLLRSEVQLAKVELKEELTQARKGAVMGAIGGVFGLLALAFLFLGATYALALVVPLWLSAVIVGAVSGIASVAFLLAAKRRFSHLDPMDTTVRTTKETVEWAKTQLR